MQPTPDPHDTIPDLDPAAEDAAADDDRRYFQRHPSERERVRHAFPGELAGTATWVRVIQVAPGRRARMTWVAR